MENESITIPMKKIKRKIRIDEEDSLDDSRYSWDWSLYEELK